MEETKENKQQSADDGVSFLQPFIAKLGEQNIDFVPLLINSFMMHCRFTRQWLKLVFSLRISCFFLLKAGLYFYVCVDQDNFAIYKVEIY